MRRIIAFALLVCAACLGAGCVGDQQRAGPPPWMPSDMVTGTSDDYFREKKDQAPAPNGGTPSGPTR